MVVCVQLLVNLVKAYQADYRRANVRAALDMLGPVLLKPKNPKYQAGDKASYPAWGRPLKQLLEEENQNKQMRIHFWQFVVRHPDVFYPCRSVTVPPTPDKYVQAPPLRMQCGQCILIC